MKAKGQKEPSKRQVERAATVQRLREHRGARLGRVEPAPRAADSFERVGVARQLLVPVTLEPEVRLPERGGPLVVGRIADVLLEIGAGGRDERLLVHPLADALAPEAQLSAKAAQVVARLVDDAEVDQREALRRPQLELVDRPLPGLEVDLRRRSDGQDVTVGQDPDARRVARVEGAFAVEVADVMRTRGPESESTRARARKSPTTCTFSSGTGASSPQRRSKSSPYSRRALDSSLDGSTRCGAPISETCTWRPGCSRTRVPAAPAWSRWMCESRRWRTSLSTSARSASCPFSFLMQVEGPQSWSASPSSVSSR